MLNTYRPVQYLRQFVVGRIATQRSALTRDTTAWVRGYVAGVYDGTDFCEAHGRMAQLEFGAGWPWYTLMMSM